MHGNYLPLCLPCHNTVTAKFDKSFRENSDGETEKKVAWLNEQRERNQILKDKKFPAVKVVPIDKKPSP